MKIGGPAALAVLTLALSSQAFAATQPNVVLILVDDLGWRDLGCTGSDYYQTPNVDRLFASGTHFTQAYASCSVCSPTRASLLTGKAPPRHGITDWIGAKEGKAWGRNTPVLPPKYVHDLPAEDTTLPEALKAAGYRTFFAGKWHLGGDDSLPTDHGFDINLGGHHKGGPPGGYFSPYNNPYLSDGPPGEHLPLRLGKETASFVEENTDRPFFAMLSFYSVHGPLQTTRERWQDNRLEALSQVDSTGAPAPQRFIFDRTKPVRQTQDHPIYAGMVEAMDDAVGLVLDAIERSGQREETIVIFTSDNGGVSSGDGRATSNLPLRGGKGRQWEGGVRVPLAITWPGKFTGSQQSPTPAISTDIYPTLLELLEIETREAQHVDGVSLADSIRGEQQKSRPLFWHYPHYGNQGGEPSSAVVHEGWKLIHYYEDGRDELYDLSQDEGEKLDLADQNGPRTVELSTILKRWLDETNARMPTVNPGFDASQTWNAIQTQRVIGVQYEMRVAHELLQKNWQPEATWWGSAPSPNDTEQGGTIE